MSRSAIEDALYGWVSAASGLTTVWSDDPAPRPAGAYVCMRIGSLRSDGMDWTVITNAPSPSPGVECVTTIWGRRNATLTLQAFAGTPTGDASPQQVLDFVKSKSFLPSVRTVLNAAGVGIGSLGAAQNVGGPLSASRFEPRAVMDVELNLIAQVAEFSTFIQTVDIENDINHVTFEVGV